MQLLHGHFMPDIFSALEYFPACSVRARAQTIDWALWSIRWSNVNLRSNDWDRSPIWNILKCCARIREDLHWDCFNRANQICISLCSDKGCKPQTMWPPKFPTVWMYLVCFGHFIIVNSSAGGVWALRGAPGNTFWYNIYRYLHC